MFSSRRGGGRSDLLPGDDQVVSERLDTLSSTVSSTAAALARVDGEIATVRRELGSGLARVEELVAELRSRARAGDVRELEKKITALTAERSRTSDGRRLDDLTAKLDGLAERVDMLSTTVGTAAASLAARDGELAALKRTLGESARGQAGALALDPALLKRVEDAAATAASAALRIESQSSQIATLAGRVEALEAASGPAADESRARLDDLGARIAAVEDERAVLAASIAEAASLRWREIERALAALTERVDAVEERCTAVASELSRTTTLWPTALRALESRLEELGRHLGTQAAPEPRREEGADLVGALRSLERRMETTDAAAKGEREAVLERLERLASRLDEGEPAPGPGVQPPGQTGGVPVGVEGTRPHGAER